MKLKEIGYPNLYYKDKRYQIIGAAAGSEEVANIGFTTGPSNRTKILTKLEEVIRNKHIKIRSTRLYDELKTFTWVGQTAKAMKGYHDDLVMAIAITVWLFDNSTDNSKYDKEMANAMLSIWPIENSATIYKTTVKS
jgi:hypothetical protein